MIKVFNHQPRRVGKEVQERIDTLKIGQKMQDLPEHLWHKSFRFYVKEDPTRVGGPNLRMIRLDPNKPSLTVTAYIFNKFVHPYENRFITPREAARLQGFPDELEFKGTLGSVQLQVGNAVPIPLGRAVFHTVLEHAKKIAPEKQTFYALSLFSGAGGLDIAASTAEVPNARWKTYASIELDKDCCETLSAYCKNEAEIVNNSVYSIADPVAFSEKLAVKKEDVWLIYGGPPCQAFSQAGKQRGITDPRGQLVSEFLRYVEELSPRYFVMENVRGLAGINKGRLLKEILETMKNLGYNVDYGLLNAADYGAPQLRKRLIFIGTKKELGKALLPNPTHAEIPDLFTSYTYMTVGEAFEGLPSCDLNELNGNGYYQQSLTLYDNESTY
ncbi:MAG: DNA (cytosine-5-)-methyltransferase [Anaerolineales bacterium]|nr:DNA (cytosine-5-)-methyltransferase [Anaerolineales bacterium]